MTTKTSSWKDVVNMKPVDYPVFSIMSKQGYEPLEIVPDEIDHFNIMDGGNYINLTLKTFKEISSSVPNDTFNITTTQKYRMLNPETDDVVLVKTYSNMVLRSYETGGSLGETLFSYYFTEKKLAEQLDEMAKEI